MTLDLNVRPEVTQKRKSLPPHWYMRYITECPVCWRHREERVRMFTPKPPDPIQRVEFRHIYDWCDV